MDTVPQRGFNQYLARPIAGVHELASPDWPTWDRVGQPLGERLHESFNARLRDELLDGEIFCTLSESQIVIERSDSVLTCRARKADLFDHLVGARDQRRRHFET